LYTDTEKGIWNIWYAPISSIKGWG